MNSLSCVLGLVALLSGHSGKTVTRIDVSDPDLVFSPYNWYRSGTDYAQSANPGAYLKFGFTGTSVAVNVDVSTFTKANVPAAQYPVVRYSVDNKRPTTVQLKPDTTFLPCATGLPEGKHSLLLQYVAGYVFLDFWTPVNVLRVSGITLDEGASAISVQKSTRNALFLGDSITNGDDDIATFEGGITNAVDTQDATLGYPAVVAAGIGEEYGIVAYGGASWDGRAADGHTPGLMTSYSMLDSLHSRLVDGKLSPVPSDIFVNMGENYGPGNGDVKKLLTSLRKASGPEANIFLIVPFSGRARTALRSGFIEYDMSARNDDGRTFLIDLGNNPYLPSGGPTMLSVDGQHPLASLHAQLAAQLVYERNRQLWGPKR